MIVNFREYVMRQLGKTKRQNARLPELAQLELRPYTQQLNFALLIRDFDSAISLLSELEARIFMLSLKAPQPSPERQNMLMAIAESYNRKAAELIRDIESKPIDIAERDSIRHMKYMQAYVRLVYYCQPIRFSNKKPRSKSKLGIKIRIIALTSEVMQ